MYFEGKTVHVDTNETTFWLETMIQIIGNNVVGKGISLWRDEEIPFILIGKYNLGLKTANIAKVHLDFHSSYTLYRMCISDNGIIIIEGDYARGELIRAKKLDYCNSKT
jgi:hypothetical protein